MVALRAFLSARGWGEGEFCTFLEWEVGKRGKLEKNLRFAMRRDEKGRFFYVLEGKVEAIWRLKN